MPGAAVFHGGQAVAGGADALLRLSQRGGVALRDVRGLRAPDLRRGARRGKLRAMRGVSL